MKEISYRKIFIFLIVTSGMSVVGYYLLSRILNKTHYEFLIWNLFLAWIPFIVSIMLFELTKRLKPNLIITFILGIIWLLFLPNSVYIVTDFIHLTVLKYTYLENGRLSFKYWYDFLLILMFAWNGLVLGFISTYQIHSVIYKKVGKAISWLFIAATSLLGGYGILLGREYRLNSWDVISDGRKVLEILEDSLNLRAGLFCCMFGAVIATIYVTFYLLINSQDTSKSKSSS